jgi:hypothetical protein
MEFPSSQGTYWLVSDKECDYLGVDYHCDLLDRYVQNHFYVLDASFFGTSSVRKLSTRKDAER